MASRVWTIAVIGGTGAEGRGLALRWAAAGHHVIIGSRDANKAEETARSLVALAPEISIEGAETIFAASKAEIVALTVPYAAELQTALSIREVLKGKILIDVTVPLVPPKVSRVQLPADDSCVVAVQ